MSAGGDLRVLADVDEDHGCGDLPASACRAVPGNARRIVAAQTLQSVGDRVVDAKTVLPWLLAVVGAPPAFVGLLVPVREAGSLLPQAALVPAVRRRAVRKWVWVAGGLGQALAAAAMAVAALTLEGAAAGAAVVAVLAAFALGRSLSSIASKDVLGRTVPAGRRGRINGLATTASGAVAITLGLGVQALDDRGANAPVLAALLAGAALVWVAAAAVYATVTEPAGDAEASRAVGWAGRAVRLLRDDVPFRRFVVVRTLLLVSALSPPFVVALAAEEATATLGAFVVASGVAALLGGRLLGGLADRSSRGLMTLGAGVASVVVVALLALRTQAALAGSWWLEPVAYLLLALAHTGVRVARKTYVVDLATGNRRTDYVAVSNTAMGVLLLLTGAVSSALARLGPEAALLFLAGLGAAGVVASRSLPEVGDAPAGQR